MNKIIYLVFYIASFIASLVVAPTYALDETDEQNMTGSAVKILKKYQGRWKGWSDGCMNCDKPLATERLLVTKRPLATKKRATKDTVKKKSKVKPKESNQSTEKEERKAQSLPKSLMRGYCECNCGSDSSMDSEASKGTNCSSANNSDTVLKPTALKPKGALDSGSEKKKSKTGPKKTNVKKSYNMDVRDTARPKDTKDNQDEKGQSEQQESNKSGAADNDGVDSSDGATNKIRIKNEKISEITSDIAESSVEETGKEKSKFSIFSIFNSK